MNKSMSSLIGGMQTEFKKYLAALDEPPNATMEQAWPILLRRVSKTMALALENHRDRIRVLYLSQNSSRPPDHRDDPPG